MSPTHPQNVIQTQKCDDQSAYKQGAPPGTALIHTLGSARMAAVEPSQTEDV